ncbi:uncharacterized protein LOC114254348 [Monomorium pharaonis]|uniref:uncharacterized protein LOC114254348 n=1 Tax=Monomorium pharaonis TaxID=307658 RepID=UPI00102E1FDC|nr:uncharacterized protein LOC114254348 [Monomorium pharaonis]
MITEMKSHTMEQCKNKFKYLKQKYVKKKDNMGTKSSGASQIKFDFFNEMDEIFRNEPNVTPLCTAPSSRGKSNMKSIEGVENIDDDENSSINQSDIESPPPKKRKTSQLEIKLENFEKNVKGKEEERGKRHKENLVRQDQVLQIMKEIADSFKIFVNKK